MINQTDLANLLKCTQTIRPQSGFAVQCDVLSEILSGKEHYHRIRLRRRVECITTLYQHQSLYQHCSSHCIKWLSSASGYRRLLNPATSFSIHFSIIFDTLFLSLYCLSAKNFFFSLFALCWYCGSAGELGNAWAIHGDSRTIFKRRPISIGGQSANLCNTLEQR